MAQTGANASPSTADLKVAISQEPNAEVNPTFLATVTNTSATSTYTFLKIESPLDPLAVHLGLLGVIPGGKSEKFDIPRVMIKRRWPPAPDQFVVLGPGQSAEQQITSFREPIVDVPKLRDDGGGKATVQLEGEWTHLWAGSYENWEGAEHAPKVEGPFQSNILDIALD